MKSLRAAYRKIFMSTETSSLEERLTKMEHDPELYSVPAVGAMLQSIRDSFAEGRRGICKFRQNGELNLSVFLESFLCKMVTREWSFGGLIAVKHEVQRQDMCSVHTCHHVIQQMQNATLVLILTEISLVNTFKTPNEALLNYTSRSVSYPLSQVKPNTTIDEVYIPKNSL
ncbi:hypothetical protein F2Q69_00009890 [Brassica cretica]|uniref:Uncharacterized protein n=1 Tax=Brassica cretica TaxID=69181 RepID=A0A8S9NYE2_BRACR|nr:hypothetical protein F2Q69_00009890 [Brassica cretica]